jgi:branched-chain amino acid aminotransferase
VADDLLLYLNGEILAERDAHISPFDRGFLWGDGVYEITPVLNGRLFHLDDHLQRLERSLRYVQIEPPLDIAGIKDVTLRLMDANADRLTPDSMYRLGHWVTRGEDTPTFAALDAGPSTLMIFLRPVDVAALAETQRTGIRLAVTPTHRNSPQSIETRAKVTSKINQTLAELDAAAHNAQALMLDLNGNISEHAISNFFLVRDGEVWTPPDRNILEGVTRKVIIELAAELDITLLERDMTLYDIAQADEYFISSSAVGLMPVNAIDRYRPIAAIPGPITQRLMTAYAHHASFDPLLPGGRTTAK